MFTNMQDQIKADLDKIVEYDQAESEKRYDIVDDYLDIAYMSMSDGDFDPYIQYGRDNLLFVKRDCMNSLLKITKYTEPEIKNIMSMYAAYAKPGKGLNMR